NVVAADVTRGAKDRSLAQASYQESGAPAQAAPAAGSGMRTDILQMVTPSQGQPTPMGPNAAVGRPGAGAANPAEGPLAPRVPSGGDHARRPAASPSDLLDREIVNEPPLLNPAQIDQAGRASPTEAAELAGVLVPQFTTGTPEESYGFPKGSRVYKINMQQAWLLAIMN